jgi:predicted glycoside hydrolase/deacetylase ChbG (UPF0249 family)
VIAPGRRVIVNADDFGLSPGVDAGIERAFLDGIVTSASLLVHASHAAEAVRFWRGHPELSLGLHVDLGEWTLEHREWTPVYVRVSLDDEQAVRREANRQLEQFRALTGVTPTHIDSHQHVHRQEPVRSVVVAMADALGVPLRHSSPDVRYCGNFYGQDADGTSHPEWIGVSALASVLSGLGTGTTEVCCHPASEVDVDTLYGRERLIELQTLCDPRVRAVLVEEGIQLCSFNLE